MIKNEEVQTPVNTRQTLKNMERECLSPSSETVQPLHTCEAKETERRIPLKELRIRYHTARRLKIQPSFRRHLAPNILSSTYPLNPKVRRQNQLVANGSKRCVAFK